MSDQKQDAAMCPDCDGWGYDRSTPERRDCPTCSGEGERMADQDALDSGDLDAELDALGFDPFGADRG